METTSNRCRCKLLLAPLALAAAALVALPAAPAAAQSGCYSGYPDYLSGSNICGTSSTGTDYEFYSANRIYFVISSDQQPYLIATETNDLGVYSAANPLADAPDLRPHPVGRLERHSAQDQRRRQHPRAVHLAPHADCHARRVPIHPRDARHLRLGLLQDRAGRVPGSSDTGTCRPTS